MKVHVITYFTGEGRAGVSAIFKSKKKAEKHFTCCVEETFDGSDESEAVIDAAVKKALKDGFFEYSGDGSGDNPWYDLSEEEVR